MAERVADGKLSLGALLVGVLFRPERCFAALKGGQAALGPFSAYLLTSALAGVGSGVALALIAEAPLLLCATILALGGAVLAPFWWVIEVRLTHVAARLVGGKGAVQDTKQAVGFGSLPNALASVPFASIPAGLWALFVRAKALRSLHQLSLGLALLAAVALQAVLLVGSVGLALSLRAVVLEAFKVPAGSMFPSVEVGDHLFVLKSSYGMLTKSAPARGDVVVFEYPDPNPEAERTDYIKRVLGLPGDQLAFDSGVPSINGWPVPRCRLGSATVSLEPFEPSSTQDYEIFVEFLAGRAYLVALENGRDDGHQGPYRISANEFWVVGDNRNNSSDSRSWNGGRGAGVPFENLKGRARWLWLPVARFGIDLADPPVLPLGLQKLAPDLKRCLAQAPDAEHTQPPPPPSTG